MRSIQLIGVVVVACLPLAAVACSSGKDDDDGGSSTGQSTGGSTDTTTAADCLAPGMASKDPDGKTCCSKLANKDGAGELRCACLDKGRTPAKGDATQCCSGRADAAGKCDCSPTDTPARDGSQCCSGQTKTDNLSRTVCSCVSPGNKPAGGDVTMCCAGALNEGGYCACLGGGFETEIAARCCSGATRFDSLGRSVCQ